MKFIALTAVGIATAACEPADDAYRRGLSDGYAAGYNTACKIDRITFIAGD